jgi:hypothetical protein
MADVLSAAARSKIAALVADEVPGVAFVLVTIDCGPGTDPVSVTLPAAPRAPSAAAGIRPPACPGAGASRGVATPTA